MGFTTRRRRRLSVGLVAAMVASLTLSAVPATPASAADSSPAGQFAWLDAWGSGSGSFGPNSLVMISLGAIDYNCDTFYPVADIYVIAGGGMPGDGAALSDVSGGVNVAFGTWGGGIIDEVIAVTQPAGKLGEGTYSIVYDECQNGKFDAGVDAYFEDIITVDFPEGELPPVDPAVAAVKSDAGSLAASWRTMLEGYALYLQIAELYETVECLTGGVISCLISTATDKLIDILKEQFMTAFGLVDPKEAALDVAEDYTRHWEGIRDDPPDPAFDQLTVPVIGSDPLVPMGVDPIEGAWVTVGNRSAVDGALTEALLHTIERYQGADAANDVGWAQTQARAGREYAALLAERLPATGDALADLRDAVAADTSPLDAAAAEWESSRARIAAAGFTNDELAHLRSLGLDETEIEAFRLEIIGAGTAGFTKAGLLAAIDDLIAQHDTTVASLAAFQAQIDVILSTLATNPVVPMDHPVAAAGGPYSTTAGGTVVLDGSGSTDLGGAITAHAWDTDLDGAFDDATGANPTTAAPAASGIVGLRVTDDDGNQDTAYAAITVTDTNTPPALAPTPVTPPQTDVAVGATAVFADGATDADSDPLTRTWYVDGVATAETDGDLTFGPYADAGIGLHEVRVVVSDGTTSRTHTWYPSVLAPDADLDGWHSNVDCDDTDAEVRPLRFEVEGNGIDDDCDPSTSDAIVNDAPIATSLLVGTLEDTPVTITLPAVDPEGDPLTFTIVSPPATGSLGAVVGNKVTYTPVANATGDVTFTFRASDGELQSAIKTITVSIAPVGDAPVAASVAAVTDEDTPVELTLFGFDPDGSPVTYEIVATPASGTLGPLVGDKVTYTPAANATGNASFTYRVTDGSETSTAVQARIKIQPVDDPTAVTDSTATTPEDTAVDIALPATDLDGDTLTFAVQDAPGFGVVTVTGSTATYTPSDDYHGDDSFTWSVNDGTAWSDLATVEITVTPVDDPPTASAVSAVVAEDTPTVIPMVGADPDGDPLTFAIVTPPANGTLSSVNGRRVVYTPGAEYAGPDSFTFTVTGNGVTTAPATASITVVAVNDTPVAVDDAGVTSNNTPVTVDVLANDSDLDSATLSVSSLGTPTGGSATVVAGGVRVVPPVGFEGALHVDYVVSDGDGASATAALTVLVTPAVVPGRTWTNETDFSAGDAFNVEQSGPNTLRLVDDAQAFNRIWVAVSTKGTIVKLDTNTGAILGEYWLSPSSFPKNPSRTTVDLDGNSWVTSRDGSSATKIGLVENGQCVDRNGNGVIDTSTGLNDIRAWPNLGGANGGGAAAAEDECIVQFTIVTATATRHVSITEDNNVWVSGTGNRSWDLIDGETGAIIRHENSVGYGGYGGLIDANGVIWSTGWGHVLRWDTANPLTGSAGGSPPDPAATPTGNWQLLAGGSQYGLCIDPSGNVWSSQYGSYTYKYAPNGALLGYFGHGSGGAQGCAIDANGDVWVAHSSGSSTVGHLKNDGTYVGNVSVSTPFGAGPTGVAVDAAGKVWATNYSAGNVVRIDPTAGPLGADGETAIGAVDFVSPQLGGHPYNYSDMTGSTLTGAPQSGTWSAVYDSGDAATDWAAVAWRHTSACEQDPVVKVSTSEDGVTYSAPVTVTNGAALSGLAAGRHLKVEATLTRCPDGASMELRDLTVWSLGPEAPNADNTEVTTPEETPVAVTLEAATSPTPGGPLTFTLLRNPGKGSISAVAPDGSLTYTPAPNRTGYDSIGFRVTDENGLTSGVAYAVIEITPVNDPPTADAQALSTGYQTPLPITLTGGDVDGDPLTYSITDPPDHGSLSAVAADGSVTYTPAAGYIGPDSFTFVTNDGTVDSAPATVSIDVGPTVPGPPIDVAGIGGDRNARVQWETPLSDGGSPILDYELRVTPGGATYNVGNKLVFIVPGLLNDTEYTFEVRARNAVGYGPWSAGSNVVKPRPGCTTSPFSDVPTTHPFCPEILWMAENGIATGYTDGTYRPLSAVVRQHMTLFVYRLAGKPNGADPQCAADAFPDVPKTHVFCGEIQWAVDESIAYGYADGTFKPDYPISRQAMAVYLYRLSGSPRGADPQCERDEFTDVKKSHFFCGEIDWLVDQGLATGYPDGSFKPTLAVSRQAMAAFIFRYNVLTGMVD